MIELIAGLTMFQWLILTTLGLLTWTYFFVRRKHSYWETQGIQGPKPTFLVGNTFSGLNKPIFQIDWDNFKQYGTLFGVYDGLQPHLVVGDPELLKQICVKDFHVFPQSFMQIYLHPVERSFLINLYGEEWKRVRGLISTSFSSSKLRKMFNLMKICIQDGMKEMDEITKKGKTFDPKHFWGRYNMDVIAKCCFATTLNAYKDDDNVFLRNFIEFFQGNPLKLLTFACAPKWVTCALKISLFPAKNLEFLRDLTLQLIENRKNQKDGQYNDFLQLLIDSEMGSDESGGGDQDKSSSQEQKITKSSDTTTMSSIKGRKLMSDEIVGASVIFLVAGYETTSTLLTWACYRLALNPDIQEKLYQEVLNVDIYDYEKISTLSYLDAVLNETLRIDPPVVLFQRVPHQDYTIPGNGAHIKKGTLISVPVYAVHHNPENFPEPEVFNPDRFIQGSVKPFTFLPFGGGPRICLGMRFALINAKLSLAVLLRNYRLFKTDKTPLEPKYSMGSILLTTEEMQLGIEPRQS